MDSTVAQCMDEFLRWSSNRCLWCYWAVSVLYCVWKNIRRAFGTYKHWDHGIRRHGIDTVRFLVSVSFLAADIMNQQHGMAQNAEMAIVVFCSLYRSDYCDLTSQTADWMWCYEDLLWCLLTDRIPMILLTSHLLVALTLLLFLASQTNFCHLDKVEANWTCSIFCDKSNDLLIV